MTIQKPIIIIPFALFLIFGFWYVEAGRIGDFNVPGTYTAQRGAVMETVTLRRDKTFLQEVNRNGTSVYTSGTWSLFPSNSQNHIAFSESFLATLNASKDNSSKAVYGEIENWFGFLSISVNNRQHLPALHKRLFS